MTTANLSVGIKTESAKQSLRELKQWMQAEIKGAVLTLNEDSIRTSLQQALSKARFKVAIDTTALRDDVNRTLGEAFATRHKLNIDTAALTQQVKAAVAAGMAGAPLPAVGMPMSASATAAQMTAAVEDAALIAAGAGGMGGGRGRRQAKRSISALDAASGYRISYSEPLSNAEATRMQLEAVTKAQAEQKLLDEIERNRLAAWFASKEAATQSLNVTQRYLDYAKQVRAEAQAQARRADAELRSVRASAMFDARSRYTNQGVRIAGALAVANAPGATSERVASVLGPDLHLLQRAGELSTYTKVMSQTAGATKESVLAHTRFRQAMDDAHSAARGFAGSLRMMWLTWGNTAPLVATFALGSAIRSTIQFGKDLEYQLKFVQVLSDGAQVSMKEFGDAVRGSMVLPTQAAEAMRGMAQNGLSLRESIAALPVVLNLATAGEMGLMEAALGATGVMAAFNLQVSEIDRVADVFAKAAAMSNTSVASMVESMKQASTVADRYKLNIEEVGAALAVMAQRNIIGQPAGTAFKTMMDDLAAPTAKAARIMEQMGLSAYNSSKQMKPLAQILKELRDASLKLNEQGRNELFTGIFEKRSAKGASALTSDLDEYNEKLDTLQNHARGFTQTVVAALGETTEGSLKRLFSEFQLTATSAFNETSNGVKNLVDQLRLLTASSGFQGFLAGTVQGLVTLTSTLVENAKAIGITVLAWMGLRGAFIAVEVWAALKRAIDEVRLGMVSLRVAAMGTWGALTGGLALVTTLVAEYFLLKEHTNASTEALKQYATQSRLATEAGEREVTRLEKQNRSLEVQNHLMLQGVAAIKAKRMAEEVGQREPLEEARSRLEIMRQELDRRDAMMRGVRAPAETSGTIDGVNLSRLTTAEVKDKVAEQEKLVEAQEKQLDRWLSIRQKLDQEVSRNDLLKRREELQKIVEANPGKGLQGVPTEQAAKMAVNDLKRAIEEAEAYNNKALPGLQKTDRAGRRVEIAEVQQLIEKLREEADLKRQMLRNEADLDRAKYSADRYGPYLAALLAEQRSIRGTNDLLEQEKRVRSELEAAKRKPNLQDPADQSRLDTAIMNQQHVIDRLKIQLDHERQMAAVRAGQSAWKDSQEFTGTLRDIDTGASKRLLDLQQKFRIQLIDPGEAARVKAELAETEAGMSAIAKQQERINQAKQAAADIQGRLDARGALSAEEYQRESELLATAQQEVNNQETRLNILQARVADARRIAGITAKAEYEYSQTAGAGWDRFWSEYRDNAESSADFVYNAMKSSTEKMGDALADFVVTGKLSFKSLVSSITEDLARMMAHRAMQQLLSLAFGSFFGGGSDAGSVLATSGSGWAGPYAKGGVAGPYGDIPLRQYRAGGVARSPQFAMFGEGSQPEAYVPLPDGRTIPVTMQGGTGEIQVNTNVYLDASGSTRTESDTTGNEAGQLAKLIEQGTVSVIVRERRPGGLLFMG